MTSPPTPVSSVSERPSDVSVHGSLPLEGAGMSSLGTAILTPSRWLRIMGILVAAALAVAILCLQVGARYVSVGEIISALGHAFGLLTLTSSDADASKTTDAIVLH